MQNELLQLCLAGQAQELSSWVVQVQVVRLVDHLLELSLQVPNLQAGAGRVCQGPDRVGRVGCCGIGPIPANQCLLDHHDMDTTEG